MANNDTSTVLKGADEVERLACELLYKPPSASLTSTVHINLLAVG